MARLLLVAPFLGVFLLFVVLVAAGEEALSGAEKPGTAQGGVEGMVCGQVSNGSVAGYRGDQLQVAAVAVHVGQELHVDQRGLVIAVATMMVESNMRPLPGGDRDSVGPYQQRAAWGPEAERRDPAASTRLFFQGGRGGQPGLLTTDFMRMDPGAAAQEVQGSAFPGRYGQKLDAARQVVGATMGIGCQPASGGAGEPQKAAIDRALSVQGTRYAWGGGNAAGPSSGTGPDAGVIGFDCSGLMVYAYAAAGVSVPHQTQAIWNAFQPAIQDRSQVRPGDMLAFSSSGAPGGIHHIGMYLGDGRMVQAPQSGDVVRVTDNVWANPYYSAQFIGALRPGGGR